MLSWYSRIRLLVCENKRYHPEMENSLNISYIFKSYLHFNYLFTVYSHLKMPGPGSNTFASPNAPQSWRSAVLIWGNSNNTVLISLAWIYSLISLWHAIKKSLILYEIKDSLALVLFSCSFQYCLIEGERFSRS